MSIYPRTVKHVFTLLNVDYVVLGKKWNYRNVLSPYYRMYYIDAGAGAISDQEQTWALEPGFIYLIPSFTLCNLECPASLGQYFIHFFEEAPDGISLFHNHRRILKIAATPLDAANFKRLLDINPFRKINRSDDPKVYEKHIYYEEYEELNKKQDFRLFMETQGILLQLVSKFLENIALPPAEVTKVPSKVIDLLGYIQVNLGERLTVNQLAAMVNLNSDHLSRLFVKLTGQRPLAYIHTKRIERAQHLIITTDLPLSAISEATGFDKMPHFIKVFKKITRITPGKYKAQHQSNAM